MATVDTVKDNEIGSDSNSIEEEQSNDEDFLPEFEPSTNVEIDASKESLLLKAIARTDVKGS